MRKTPIADKVREVGSGYFAFGDQGGNCQHAKCHMNQAPVIEAAEVDAFDTLAQADQTDQDGESEQAETADLLHQTIAP